MRNLNSSLDTGENPSPSTNNSLTVITPTEKITSKSFNYVNLDLIDKELACPICFFPFYDPVVHSSCGNTFCRECVNSLSQCPICHEGDFSSEKVTVVKIIRNQLDKLAVFCPMCKNVVNRGELKNHQEKYCPLRDAYQQVEQMKRDLEKEFEEKKMKLEQEFQEKNQKLDREHSLYLEQAENELKQKEKELMKQF
ncbi:hypothetical protein FDP41_001796 [Naegleria fowleri]|uniref:RING-type domain-containing protein n=1 Tax=Naegleria fowleri TaxID=5763 RepID=A0A6A5BN73_NAEFO|nr:uncharacterized protein FDP41_001796 [Naegleria fowleri]KAF0979453.1 hypothetical protein FDP41_001796 [Naegleria fowleri]